MGKTALGDLQYAIMRILWDREEATVNDVHGILLPDRGLALTTVATMLRKMEVKGVVTHRTDGRQFVYRPTVTQNKVKRSMVRELVDRLFNGDPAALVTHLVEDREVDPDELRDLVSELAITEYRKKEDNG